MGTPMPPQHRWSIAALVLVLATVFAGGVWSMTLSPLEQRATASAASAAAAPVAHISAAPPHRLRFGTTVSGQGSVVADAAGTTWVLGPGTLSTITDGSATAVAHGGWSGHALLTPSNEGGLWIASGRFLWMVSSTGGIGERIVASVGQISAILAADGRTWVAGSSGMLAWIDPYTGNAIQSYYLGSGTYQLAAASNYVFVANTDPTLAPIVRLDPAAGAAVPVPGAQPGPIATTDGHLWWGAAGGIHCVVARTLHRCGQVDVADPAIVAARGEALWVVDSTARGPELVLFDAKDGRTIAGPTALPGSTVATVEVGDTSGWIGMRDSGNVIQVERT